MGFRAWVALDDIAAAVAQLDRAVGQLAIGRSAYVRPYPWRTAVPVGHCRTRWAPHTVNAPGGATT
ncbi:hypothetical protein ACFYRY_24270 [Streptomyces sp. NPDC005263]|uniref:hypothetical protein n=1 Tax=Streptomyces sp. NPDC005263 TaxID=3364711 RepID=UPI0036B02AB1